MNIAIIVYSQTGNTIAVAEKFKEVMAVSEHNITIEKISVQEKVEPGKTDYHFESKPEINDYDMIVFGSPVQAFSLTSVMECYLDQLDNLQDKEVACFVTKRLPFYWTGGIRAIKQMKKILESKGAKVQETGIIRWTKKKREEDINDVLNRFKGIIS
ncbi:MAG: flavodoxin family protein [Halanaerobiales bacterium]